MHVHAVLLLDVIVSATCMVHMHCLPCARTFDWGMRMPLMVQRVTCTE